MRHKIFTFKSFTNCEDKKPWGLRPTDYYSKSAIW